MVGSSPNCIGQSKAAGLLSGGLFSCRRLEGTEHQKSWEEIQHYLDEGWVVTIGTRDDPSIESTGLVANHAYSILSTHQYKDESLVLIRNPWGKKEWTGAWSDHDRKTKNLRKRTLKHEDSEDGVFVIPMKDVMRYFEALYLFKTF